MSNNKECATCVRRNVALCASGNCKWCATPEEIMSAAAVETERNAIMKAEGAE
jgi:hypothetical protein